MIRPYHPADCDALLDVWARALRGDLEVEVFERNPLGRAFYSKLGFALMHRKTHEQTGFEVLRLQLPAERS